MPVKNPRINVVVEQPLYRAIHNISEREGISMSMVMRDLVRDALELREDIALAKFAENREKTLDRSKTLSHKQVWG